ncbi:MAG: PAS domain-containing sensor histidine kinase [Alphaproteobacteria bacterium]|nr:PAS domain-containing sensor histidine kinase [Alphaproteobacteria bacterium]
MAFQRISIQSILGYRSHDKKRPPKFRQLKSAFVTLLVLASIISCIATYGALTETPPFGNDPDTVIWLLNINFVLLLLIVGIIVRRIVSLWSGRKRKLAGSHLHVRLVYIFSMLAAIPAITMMIFSAVFFYFGVQTWFSDRVQTAVDESQAVAEAYLEEHTQTIRADVLAMANDLNREAGLLLVNEQALAQVVQTQSILRDLSEAIIFDTEGRIIARSNLTFSLEFEDIPVYAMNAAEDGEVIIMTGGNEDRVRALVKLDNFLDAYLFVGRMIDPQVLSHLAATRKATQDYATLQDRLSSLQVTLTMIFVVVGLLLLTSAIWFGLLLARQLVNPISTLITTADRVRAGDLSARVPEQKTIQEFEYLAQSFNRMTRRVQEQQSELLDANRQLDRRRHFTETVLTGVTSGVIGVNQTGEITVVNASASELLGIDKEGVIGKSVEELIPELKELLIEAHKKPNSITQGELPIERAEAPRRVFLFRITSEKIGDEETGTIVTFDDITALQSAQRKAAWADVARRIAHEIKNPLTPIQLSAERLQRKYFKDIKNDPETFAQCIATIIKNVEDIGHMVNEFSSFARMPEPKFKVEDVNANVQDALSIYRQAHSKTDFMLSGFEDAVYLANIDQQLMRQALNNLLQNALDSVTALNDSGKEIKKPKISVVLGTHNEDEMFIAISDNGAGFPKDKEITSLLEPYVTHKEKGTGLGLAIVKKIMDDHNGELILGAPDWLKNNTAWTSLGGATAVLILPIEKISYSRAQKSA